MILHARRCLLLLSITCVTIKGRSYLISTAGHELTKRSAHYYPSPSPSLPPFNGLPTLTPEWPHCFPVIVSVIETHTILQSGSLVTAIYTSTSKVGTVLNATQTATSSALERRQWKSNDKWTENWTGGVWTTYAACSPETLTETSTAYTTALIPGSIVVETTVAVLPGM